MKIPRIIHENILKNGKNDVFLSHLAPDYHQIEKTPGRKVCQEVK
ncbi:hypothetical protein LEP1GSC193_3397 [Leptospira alstonii serovar Pingchang str. 80-412]|uniref:Uncharacterized protein n=2 Tax=Leptospira alstonii TaxID=28452 RepID=M6D1B8_9LEPT|nr:hypothetical protein LEP1GSC194_3931 [Leptospira alstonii serovar Sichuan str. 79601]EQA82021.1 hypothetical protein LEP1GSC193_3397 [Leptospira alstonii serovar Pingchang str. 80-412]